MRKLAALLLIMPLCIVQLAFAQNRTITGTVGSSKDNSPLPGATVLVKGTAIGTVTDVDGKYTLSVPSGNDVLTYSFVGYKDHDETISGRSVINVSLDEDVYQLDNVVVTAIGIKQQEKAINYSAQTVDGDLITSGKNTDLMNNLSGKVAGLSVTSSSGDPGSSAFMTIRGSRSITGNNQPLIVIDGVPFSNNQMSSGNMNDGNFTNSTNNNLTDGVSYSNRGIDLNPNDIQTITVLKGAAATALYGSKAANGAIIITTKQGGGTNATGSKMNVSLTSSLTFDQISNMPDLQNQYIQGSGGQWLGPETHSSGSWGPEGDTMSWDGSDYLYDSHGMLVSNNDPTAKTPFTPYDNVANFFVTGKTFDNTLSLSGGDANSNYYASFGYLDQTGVVPNSDFSRYSIRLTGDSKLGNKWNTSGTVNYVKSGGTRIQQGSNISGLMLGLLRTPISFDNSNGVTDPTDPASYLFPDGTQRNYRGGVSYDNPFWTINQNPFTDDVNRMYGNTELDYTPIKWLSLTYRLGGDFYSDRRKQQFAIGSGAFEGGQIDDDNIFYRQINGDLLATFNCNITDDIKGTVIVGNNMNTEYTQQEHAQGDGLVIPDFYNISNATSVLDQEYHQIIRTLGYYTDAEFNWKEEIYLGLTGRVDQASTFSKSFFYPSANLGLVFTDLLGISDNKILPYGKIRFSYAEVGNSPQPFLENSTYTQAFYGDGWINGINFPFLGEAGFMNGDNLGNPDLQPENTKSFEVGTDLKFYKNLVGLDFTYYDATSTGQIIDVPIAATSGFLTETLNAADVENSGIEITLSATPVKTKNFKWDLTLNFTHNVSMVNSLADGISFISLNGFTDPIIAVVAGQPFGSIFGTQWLKDSKGNIIIADSAAYNDALAGGVNGAYLYDVGYPMFGTTTGVIGNPTPKYLASLINEFTWKGISLMFQWDQRKGGDIWNGTRGALDYFGRSEETANRDQTTVFDGVMGHLDDNLNVVTDGTQNTTEVLPDQNWAQSGFGSGFTGPAEAYIEDGSYIKLREVDLTYSFSPKMLGKTPFTSLNIGVSARNLAIITKYNGVDPETSLFGADNSQGIDYFNNPGTRSYGINLGLTL